jgi:hypothetical protein
MKFARTLVRRDERLDLAQQRLVARARAREEVRATPRLALQRRVKQPLDLFPTFGSHRGMTGTS